MAHPNKRPASKSPGKSPRKTAPLDPKRPPPKTKKGQEETGPRIRLRFVTSAVDMAGCPRDSKPEVALVGRSNSGKSSLLNGIGMERVAKISSMPGKTRLLNFFDAGHEYRMVDMPGYGFSVRPGDEHHGWKKMIESYLRSRENLTGLLLLMDIRREWTDDEQLMVDWLEPMKIPVAVVLTKIDKLSKTDTAKRIKAIRASSGIPTIFATSSLKHLGFEEIEEFVFNKWIKPRL